MTPSTTYGTALAAEWVGQDGPLYRALVLVAGYLGGTTVLPCLQCVAEWSMGESGGVPSLGPAAPAAAQLMLRQAPGFGQAGMTLPLAGRPDGFVALAIQRSTTVTPGVSYGLDDSGWTTQFAGFLLPESVDARTYAGSDALQLRFAGGLHVSAGRAFAGSGAPAGAFGDSDDLDTIERFQTGLARILQAIGSADDLWTGLTTCVDWRPWVPTTHVPASVDPVRAVGARQRAWLVDGASVSERDAVRTIARRLQARLYQSEGRWYMTQRSALARALASGGAGTIPEFAYDANSGAIDNDAQTAAARNPVVDTWGWNWQGAPDDSGGVPMRRVEVEYDFRPDLDDLMSNGSFETAGSAGATVAQGWSMTGGGTGSGGVTSATGPTVCQRFSLTTGTPPFQPTAGDVWAARFSDDRATPSRPVIAQGGVVRIPSDPNAVIRFRSRLQWQPYTGAFDDTKQARPAYLAVGVETRDGDTYSVKRSVVTATAPSLPGDSVRIPIDPFLASYPDHVDGTAIVPAGIKVRFSNPVGGTHASASPVLTLTKAVVVGATELEGDISDDLDSGATAALYYFSEDLDRTAIRLLDETGESTAPIDMDVQTYAVTPDGLAIDGAFVTWFEGARLALASGVPVANAEQGSEVWSIDRVEVGYLVAEDGRTRPASKTGAAAMLSGGVPGALAGRAEAHEIGDGPVAESDTALVVQDGAFAWQTTTWGDNTGWTVGAYGSGAPSSGDTIDALDAIEAVRQAARATALRGTLKLKGDGTAAGARQLHPHQVIRHWPRTTVRNAVVATSTMLETYVAPRVGGTLRHVAGDGTVTDRTVADVEPTSLGYLVTISSAFGVGIAPGDRLYVDRHYWWDAFGRDFLQGTIAIDASGLDLYTDGVTVQSTLG
ncbi:hypothetical protein B1759_14940 [Rubrivirga sp. SAORIC476]|uniref:hypothetical protein n=1 Tax=Rubrivirga sp. SAORIC476 TaxID=1961794 RepID=UPI000BA98231|nr:hypothetical protein [Rubrivirga sp. SAORIC476]PAP79614.1 hypothetical protein B1759_14940 [Rubrivirga sp. SAORIC476]